MGPAQLGAHQFDLVSDLIQTIVTEYSLPSIAVAVASAGEIVWEAACGWADIEQRVPATPHTLYSVASISKPMTATALMLLAERGLVDIDRPINSYLGAAKVTAHVGSAAGATLRRVLSHTAGLPLHYHFFYDDESERPPPFDETIRRYGHLMAAPGERYQYSNLGYGLLGEVIARVSGRPYADFMHEELFLPLGMPRARVVLQADPAPPLAERYGADGLAYPFYTFDHIGGSAVFCSVHELARFGMFHIKAHLADQRPILSDATLDMMQAGGTIGGQRLSYGLGWMLNPQNMGEEIVGHDGGMGGVRSLLCMLPDEQLVVAVLMNSSRPSPAPYGIAEEIFALLPSSAERPRLRRLSPQRLAADWPGELLEALRGEWRGAVSTYERELPLALWFTENGEILAQLGTQRRMLLSDVGLANGRLSGRLASEINIADTRRRPHWLSLDLALRGELINGAVTAISPRDPAEGGAPARRVGNALSYWAELRRAR